MKRIVSIACAALLVTMTACAPRSSQNSYKDSDVGISHAVEFGTVLNIREIDISAKSTGIGAVAGGAAGAGVGSYIGNGSGNAWATAGTAVVGAIAGYYAEHELSDRKGLEYVVQMQSGEVKTIAQEIVEGDKPIKEGDHVMLQYCDAGEHAHKCSDGSHYQRLLPIKKLPPYVKKKRKFVQTKETGEYSADKPAPADADFELVPLDHNN